MKKPLRFRLLRWQQTRRWASGTVNLTCRFWNGALNFH